MLLKFLLVRIFVNLLLRCFGASSCCIQRFLVFCMIQLKKNIVPTKDEGIATSMNELKQAENGECGDMELEECEIVTPLNLPEQEENMGNVNFCLRQPEYEDMDAKECGIATIGGAKRKLDELYHTRPALA